MNIIILGAGISGVALAHFLQEKKNIKKITLLEKDSKPGGLLRSYNVKGIAYDIGPHIIFSKHKEILDKNIKILDHNVHKIRRSNKIIYKNRYVKYPFENELSKLPKEDRQYCLNSFIKNPFEKFKYANMQQFFLSLFGEGITRTYLEPYNRKIWKFDPAFMDTQMVERIPKPPKQDIINSAKGIKTEGYKHQLYFHYPKKNGIQALFDSYLNTLNKNINDLETKQKITKVFIKNKKILVKTKDELKSCDTLFSTIPLNEFCKIYDNTPKEILDCAQALKYNSIIIAVVNVKKNIAGNNFAFMVPDKDIIFHRLSKLDFLGKNYSIKGTTSFLVEITFREGDLISKTSNKNLIRKIYDGLKKIKFVKKFTDINFFQIKKFKYAYVIYDLDHRKNVDKITRYFKKKNIHFAGRLGSWEYLNSDQVIFQAEEIIKNLSK
jgi:protoporphyrinogen oxidase